MTKRKNFEVVAAKELRDGDVILHPRYTVRTVILPKPMYLHGTQGEGAKTKVQVFFQENSGSGVYRPDAPVSIVPRKVKR